MPEDRTDPHEEAAVRRLLAQARHDEPIPHLVAARIDVALAAERDEPAAASPVASFSRTRRRRATALLLAAAAVVVVGIGIDQLADPSSPAEQSTSSASGTDGAAAQDRSRGVDRGEAAATASPTDPASPDTASEGLQDSLGLPAPDGALRLRRDPPRITEERFGRDVRAVRRQVLSASPGPGRGPSPTDAPPARGSFTCVHGYVAGRGLTVAVRYAQAPAVLVLRPPTGESQVADLVSCGDGTVVRSVTLPVP